MPVLPHLAEVINLDVLKQFNSLKLSEHGLNIIKLASIFRKRRTNAQNSSRNQQAKPNISVYCLEYEQIGIWLFQ
jgi:hypothetical protein